MPAVKVLRKIREMQDRFETARNRVTLAWLTLSLFCAAAIAAVLAFREQIDSYRF